MKFIIICVLERQKQKENNKEMKVGRESCVRGQLYYLLPSLQGFWGKKSGLQACLASIFDLQSHIVHPIY